MNNVIRKKYQNEKLVENDKKFHALCKIVNNLMKRKAIAKSQSKTL